ncbi:MAG: transporter, partial [Rhodospirillum sp.]|nr:transporter [Rhodospirillum sp.]
AKEGTDQYPQGAEGFMAGALPPPGFYLLGYGVDYRGDLVDGQGDKVITPTGESISVRANAVAARVLYMSDFQFLGGNWGAHMVIPVFDVTMEAGSASQHKTGLGDITFDPFILAWHWKDWHLATGLDITAPTGRYDAGDLANIGANYWSFEPLVTATYRNEDGWEASAKLMYNIKTENTATNYQSGDEFHMDYALVKNFEDWSVGLGGYFVHQIQRDEVNGVEVADSIRQTFAIGPQIQYRYQNMAFSAKWQNEVYSRNTFDGNRFNLKVIYAF